jgi:hypothetical protein
MIFQEKNESILQARKMSLTNEDIKNLRACYKEFLDTEEGKECIEKAVEIKHLWNMREQEHEIHFQTAGVKMNQIPRRLRAKITKVKIEYPLGLNNMCHINAEKFRLCGFERRVGFNLTACPCGKNMSYELHSLNEKDGVLHDFTRDFAGETEKYFLKLETDIPVIRLMEYLKDETFFYINKGCKCKIEWVSNMSATIGDYEFEEIFEGAEKI